MCGFCSGRPSCHCHDFRDVSPRFLLSTGLSYLSIHSVRGPFTPLRERSHARTSQVIRMPAQHGSACGRALSLACALTSPQPDIPLQVRCCAAASPLVFWPQVQKCYLNTRARGFSLHMGFSRSMGDHEPHFAGSVVPHFGESVVANWQETGGQGVAGMWDDARAFELY